MSAHDQDCFARIAAQIQDAQPYQPDDPGYAYLAGSTSRPLNGAQRDNRESYELAYTKGLHPMAASEFLQTAFPPRQMMLAPWLPTKGLAMIYAPRGMGKTHVSLGVACAVACGDQFLNWAAPEPRRVLFIDGEMPAHVLQERLRTTLSSQQHSDPGDRLAVLAADCEPDGLPDLADPQAQPYYDDALRTADLIIIDNLSTTCRSLRENDADSWGPVQAWALAQRRAGKSVLLIHHAGKGGQQRGTSRKEDVLDSVIALRRPPGYTPTQGARFELHFEKSRGFHGPEAEPIEAWLKDGTWTVCPVTAADDDGSLVALSEQGLSVRDIASRTGLSKSTVARKINSSPH